MEEDSAVKAAPVTRLRRRLSVETEETKSPSAPSTPTKKRAARLAAKPQLELIDEHAVTDSPKRVTRTSISRDVAEPEEKPVTPARRSARTKSNTSLASEADEKPLTPARRSTRIKSNTSIVSEAAQSVESPRAKRATARRNSQVGSDTETPLTPARTRRARKASISSIDKDETPSVTETAVTPGRTRRTRKGSTSSIDTLADAALADKQSLITEVIAEEPEGKLRKSTSNDTSNVNEIKNDSPTRKSPRLMAKKGRKIKSEDDNETPKQSQNSEGADNLPMPTEQPNEKVNVTQATSEHHDISISSANLIKDLDTKLKKKISNKNKSLSDVEYTTESKKRDRTKSWTTLCASPQLESNFFSDNESTKKKLKKHGKIFNAKRLSLTDDTGSGDGPKQIDAEMKNVEENEQSFKISKTNRKSNNKSANLQNSISENTKEVDINNESNKENLLGVAAIAKDKSAAEQFFENEPSADVKSMVFIEDSDSNNGNLETRGKEINNEDQCVPVVLHESELKNSSEKHEANDQNIFAIKNIDNKVTNNHDVEPMDIDETIPENVSLSDFTDEGNKSRKSLQNMPHKSENATAGTPNKSNTEPSVPEVNENIENRDIIAEHQNISVKKDKKSRKSSLSVAQESDHVDRVSSETEINTNVENLDIPAEDQNNSINKTKQRKKTRKSTLDSDVGLEPDNHDNSKRKSTSSLCHSTSEENKEEKKEYKKSSNEEQDVSLNESIKNKKSRKFSLGSQESNNNLTTTSISEDKTGISINKSTEVSEASAQNKKSKKKASSIVQDGDELVEGENNSKRKYSCSTSMDHEKTGNESKSTLVLSQMKDVSGVENSAANNMSELSKSINIDGANNKDAHGNKNLALNYLTSTPVQQKNIDKIAMQMNTSVITPTIESKKVDRSSNSTLKKNVSIVSKSSDDNSSDEDSQESDEESSQHSNLFDDQAEDAGEDYESGDSQDDEEREYERENEIIEKGETLTSEEDISDDSDYEKDSFIVSSDEEDNELLSGSGDNLGISDNELSLSAKSKKKYNERKLKEQKKASREMFEARHGYINSNQKTKSKTSNRSRLDSTLLKSDEDVLPPKKNKRMRLESTMETSQVQSDAEDAKSNKDITVASEKDEIGYKKKKSKRLSESVCHESTINEKEITICNQSTIEKEDPLLQIKMEPKTPIKDLDISRVHVTDDVEQVHVDENMSIMKSNETSDPLQSTMLQEENVSENDSISENEEISENYDSVLKNLNKVNKKLINSLNISLNLDKKTKKTKESIVEELNLTLTKVSKKDTSIQAKEKSVKRVFKKLADSDTSSSTDLQLLFSDESNGSKTCGVGAKESIIPLKKSEARTDIPKSMDLKQANESLNTSRKKKSKKTITADDTNDNEGSLNFFIDTKGDLSDKATNGDDAGSKSDDAPVEMLYVSNKKNNNTILSKTPTSEKKKKKILESEEQDANFSVDKTPADKKTKVSESSKLTPLHNTQVSEKKKKLSLSQDDTDTALPKTPVSDKKSRKISESKEVSMSEDIAEQKEIVTNEITASNAKKRKRKTSANKTIDDIESEDTKVLNTSQKLNESVLGNKKKKVKISKSIDDQIEENVSTSEMKKPLSEQTDLKKTKKNKHPTVESVSEPAITRKTKKRKERDEEVETISKVFKENSFDKVHVPRLPAGIIDQLDEMPADLPKKETAGKRKAKTVVATSDFVVEETVKRKNKPSDFLEETVYLNDDNSGAVAKKKSNMKKPKVLPFLPTVSTSDSGFTTNFQVNVISEKMEFLARPNEVPNFKNDYLNNRRIKKLRTYDLYKKQRNMKLSKY